MSRILFSIGFLFCFSALVASIAWRPFLREVANYLIVKDPLQRADAIVVLAGGAAVRAPQAAELFRNEKAGMIALPGDMVPPDMKSAGIEVTESELSRRELIRAGVPADRIHVIPGYDRSTCDEARLTREFAEKMGWKTIIVVTSKYHTRRSRLIFRRAFRGTGVRIMVCPSRHDAVEPSRWWQRARDLLYVNNEYLKILHDAFVRRCI